MGRSRASHSFSYLLICWIAYHLTKSEILNFQPWLQRAGQFYALYSEPVSLLVFLFFFTLSVKDFRSQFKLKDLEKKSLKTRKTALGWAMQLLVFQLLLALIWIPTVIISHSGVWPFGWSEYYPVEILLVIFLYWIAVAGYFRTKSISSEPSKKTNLLPATAVASPEMEVIRAAMEKDLLYRDSELNLTLLSDKTGLAVKTVSKVLNQAAGMNFNDFVNSYRVEAFCRELENEENGKLTLQGIAFSCGFSSSATFQRTFKKFKGETPSVYFQRKKEVGESGV